MPPCPKPTPRRTIKRQRLRVAGLMRKLARALALDRAGWKCERCGRAVSDTAPEWAPERAHVNEKVPRSRGGDPCDLSNLEVCCQSCHMPNGRHAPTKERMERLR